MKYKAFITKLLPFFSMENLKKYLAYPFKEKNVLLFIKFIMKFHILNTGDFDTDTVGLST